MIPDLSGYRLGKRHLRGVRCIHTHLKNEPLSQDDLTDLALLRLDLMVAIGILEDGLPGNLYIAHLLPFAKGAQPYEVIPATPFHQLNIDMDTFVDALEDEMARARQGREVVGKEEQAILVSVSTGYREMQEESMEELKELARTSNLDVVDTILQRPKKIHPKYLMGTGKLKELIIQALQLGVAIIVFDQNLSP
ncbi:MAG: GTPase HflX, partial [Thermodesulfobacteriota bacterium]